LDARSELLVVFEQHILLEKEAGGGSARVPTARNS